MVVLCALLLENCVGDIVISMTRKIMWSVPTSVMTTGITFSINIGRVRFKCTYIFDLKELVTVNTLFNITQLCESLCNLNRPN